MRKIRRNSTEILLVGPIVKTDGVTSFQSCLLTSASAAVAFLHDTPAAVDISSLTWTTASTGGTIIPGYYHITLTSAITSVAGPVSIAIQNSSDYLPVRSDYEVIGSAPFDSLYSSAPNILTSFDLNLLYESTVASTDAALRFEMDDSIVTSDNWIGMAVTIQDVSTNNSHPTWVTDVSAATDLIEVASTATFTPVVGDKLRVWGYRDPRYSLNTYDAAKGTDVMNVNVQKINNVDIIGSGSADSLFRTDGT